MRLNYQGKILDLYQVLSLNGKSYRVTNKFKKKIHFDDEVHTHVGWGLECLDEPIRDGNRIVGYKTYEIDFLKDKKYEFNNRAES